MRNLLTLVQTAAAEIGFPAPPTVVSNTDDTAVQMLALANREGKELSTRTGGLGGWHQLTQTQTITTVSGQIAYDEPANLSYYVNQSGWDNDKRIELMGPLSAQTWQFLKHSLLGTGYGTKFRVIDGQINLDPAPGDGQTFTFEYYSNQWCQSAAGVPQSVFTSDTDTPLLPDDLFILGIKWRFLRAKRLDFAFELDEYKNAVDREMSRASQSRVLSLVNDQEDSNSFEAFG